MMTTQARSWLAVAAIAVLSLTACADGGGGGGCPAPTQCDASPTGTWTRLDCIGWEHLNYTLLINGTDLRTCTLDVESEHITTSGQIVIADDGSVTLSSRLTGPWSGLVVDGCLAAFETSCAELDVFDDWGATGCAETADGCRCEGTLDRTVHETGTWGTGAELTLSDPARAVENTYTPCVGLTYLQLNEGTAFRRQ